MGRGGRSSGRSSSGGGSRSRSSGGRSSSSSGRSRSSSSSRSRSSSSSSGFRNSGSGFGSRRNYGGSYSRGSGGCLTTIITIFIVIIVVAIAVASEGGFGFGSNKFSSGDVTKSTVKREALPKSAVVETDYYTDELGWISNKTKLTTGLKNFYNKTGVQPHLYLTDTVNGTTSPSMNDMDNYSASLYDELFTDEGHLLLLFWESNDEYMTWYVAGNQAKTVIDSEAADILLDYIDYYYYTDLTEDEMFSKAFDDAGNKIMKVDTPLWIPVAVVAFILIIIIILFVWWKKHKAQRNLEAQQTVEILNTPVESLGSSPTGLEDRYE